ncbi:hypothetical protein PAEPH01_0147 [Pancytospora epiphaga]|nr:hypothetical protein PAEPH01_0147 [Pancytospora epiphaga]
MFLTDVKKQSEEEQLCFVGEFQRIDDDYVVLKNLGEEIKVEYKGIDAYKSKYVLVVGSMKNGVFSEENVYPVEDDFDYGLYKALTKTSMKYPELV